MSRLCILLLIAVSLTRASSSKCLKEKTTPGREILCYTTSYDVRRLDNAICRCTTLVHQGHDLQKLNFTELDNLRKYIKETNSDLRIVVSLNDDQGALGTDTLKDAKQQLMSILKEVDGVELNVTSAAKEQLVSLVKEIREDMIENKDVKMIFLALPTKPEDLVKKFDLRELSKYVDLFTVATHYLRDEEEAYRTFHPSRLMGLFDMLNTDSLVDLVSGLGATKQKILISIPASAYKFTLLNDADSVPNSATKEKQPDVLDRKQLCELMSDGQWTLERDEDLTAPYAFKDDNWIAFEDNISLGIKGKYIMLRELAGIGIRDAENDLENSCGKSLAQEAHRTFAEMKRKPRDAVLTSLEKDLQNKETSYNRHVRASDYRISRIIDTKGKIHSIRENYQTEFTCTRQGFFVHPKSCNRFYRCVKFNQHVDDYSVFEFDCPAGLAFDENAQVCVWPGSLSKGSACPGSSEIPPVPKSRFKCPKNPGYYADPENCRWFFACYDLGGSHMIPYEFRCPYGLVFDEHKLICEWPWLVPHCKGSGHDHDSGGYDFGHGVGYGGGGQYGHGGYDSGHGGGYDNSGGYDNGRHYGQDHGYDNDGQYGQDGGYNSGGGYNNGGQYGQGGGYDDDGQYDKGGGYDGDGQYGQRENKGDEGQYGQGGGYGSDGQYGQGGNNGDDGQYGHGGDSGDEGQYGQGGGYGSDGQYGQGGGYGSDGQYGQGGGTGNDGQYGQGGGYDSDGQYGQGGDNGDEGQYGQAGSYDNSGHDNQGGSYDNKGFHDQEEEYVPMYKTGGGGYGDKDDGNKDDSYGSKDGDYGGKSDGQEGNNDAYGGMDAGYPGKHDSSIDDGYGGTDDGYGSKDDGYGEKDGDHGEKDGGYGGADDGYDSKDDGYGEKDGDHGEKDGGYGGADDGYGSKDDGYGEKDGDHGEKDGGYGEKDGGYGDKDGGYGEKDAGFDDGYVDKDDGGKDDGYGGMDEKYGGEDDGHGEKDNGYEGKGEHDDGKDDGYGMKDDGYGSSNDGYSGKDDDGKDDGYGGKDDGYGEKDYGYGGKDDEHEDDKGVKDDEPSGKDSGEYDDGKYSVGVSSTEGYDDVKHGSSTTPLYDVHSSTSEHDHKEDSSYGGGSDISYPDQEVYGKGGISTTPSYPKESSSTEHGHHDTGYSTEGHITDGHSTTSKEYPEQETYDNGFSDHSIYDGKGVSSTTPSYDQKNSGGYDGGQVGHSTGGYSTSGYPEQKEDHSAGHGGESSTVAYDKNSDIGGYDVKESEVDSHSFDDKVTNAGSTGYHPVTSGPTVHIGSGSGSSTAGSSGFIDQNVEYPSSGHANQEDSNSYTSTATPYTPSPHLHDDAGVEVSTGYFDGDSGHYSKRPYNISKPDFPPAGNFAYDVSVVQQSPHMTVGQHGNQPFVGAGHDGTYNCNNASQREKIRVPTGNYNPPTFDNRPQVTGATPLVTTYRGSYQSGSVPGYVRPSFGRPTYAKPGGFNNQYSPGTYRPAMKQDMGYKTNEYVDNGGRGTIRFNNGAIATKYAESDIHDYRPYDASLPASFIPEGSFGNNRGSSRIIVGNQPQSDILPFNQFTKTGPTRTGIVTAQLGGSGTYVAGSQPRPRPNPDLIGERAFEGNVGYIREKTPPRTQSPYLNIQILNSPAGSTSQNPLAINKETNNVQYPNSKGTSVTPVTYITPLQDFKSTVYNAANMTPDSITLRPIVNNGYKSMITSERIPAAVTGNTGNRINGFYITRPQPILNIGMTLEPPRETNVPVQTSTKYPPFASSGLKVNGNVPNTPIATYQQTFTGGQQGVTSPPSNVVMNKVISPIRIYPQGNVGSQPSRVSTSYPNQVFVPSSTSAPSSGAMYNKQFVPARISAPADSTNQGYNGISINSNSPTLNLRPPPNSQVNCNDHLKVLPNIARGSVRYTPQTFDSGDSKGNFKNKIIQSTTYLPPVTTYSGVHKPRPSTNSPFQVNKVVSSTSSVSKSDDKKVIVKLSDLHPLILGKLGAECTCKADPFAIFRGSGTKSPLPIDSTNKGRVDLANYDESEIYVDLDKIDYDDSLRKVERQPSAKIERSRAPLARRPPATYSVSKSVSSSAGEAVPLEHPSTEGPSSTYVPSSTYAPSTYTSSPSPYPSSTLRAPDMSVSVAGPTSLVLNIHDDTASSQSIIRSRSRSRSGKSLSSDSEKQVHPQQRSRGSVRASSSEISAEMEETVKTSSDCARPGLFRHPKFCNKFYVCHWDEWKKRFTLHVLNCPIHLSFDASAGACNWPRKGPACQDNNLLV